MHLNVLLALLEVPHFKEACPVLHALLVPLLLITLAHSVTLEPSVLRDLLHVPHAQLDLTQSKEAQPVVSVPLVTSCHLLNVSNALPEPTPLIMLLNVQPALMEVHQALEAPAVPPAPLVPLSQIINVQLAQKELSLVPQTPHLVLPAQPDITHLLEALAALSPLPVIS